MAVNEGDILNQLNVDSFGRSAGDVYGDFLTDVAKELTDEYKEQINKTTRGSGGLASSVIPIPTAKGFTIEADFYYDFVDQGVSGAPAKGIKPIDNKVTNGRYKFKTLYGSREMFKRIRSIVPGDDSKVWGAMINIKKRGIKPHNITDAVITDEVLTKISDDLSKVTGIMIKAVFNKSTK